MLRHIVSAQLTHAGERIVRRSFLRRIGGTVAGAGAATVGWREMIMARARDIHWNGKAMILLWLDGGPSQFKSFAPKPGSKYQGPTKAISTCVPGIALAEYWPETARVMDKVAVIRSMSGGPASHDSAIQYVRAGYEPTPAVKHPTLGSVVAWQREQLPFELPAFVRVGRGRSELPSRNPDAGCLGVNYDPLWAREPGTLPPDVGSAVTADTLRRRVQLTERLDRVYAQRGAASAVKANRDTRTRALRLTLSPQLAAFDLSREPSQLRDAYGRSAFGQGCLLARRLVEQGVSFVEVLHADWDTHKGPAFKTNAQLSREVDRAYASLLRDLDNRGLLETTLIVLMGEFGRSPEFRDDGGGRDHYSKAYSAAFAGGGVLGGRVIGATDPDGVEVVDRPVSVPDLMVTYCRVLGIDPREEYVTADERPIKLVEGGSVVSELFA